MFCCAGKGPQKTYYSERIARKEWRKVQFCLPWLAAEDYPLILGEYLNCCCFCGHYCNSYTSGGLQAAMCINNNNMSYEGREGGGGTKGDNAE